MAFLPILGYAVFIVVFVRFLAYQFEQLIKVDAYPDGEEHLGFGFWSIVLVAMLSWYYSSWHVFVEDKPGITTLVFAAGVALARYKTRDLFNDEANPEDSDGDSQEDGS